MTRSKNNPGSLSSRIPGAVLLMLLPVIAVWVALEGRNFDAEVYGLDERDRSVTSGTRGPKQAPTPQAPGNLIPDSLLPPLPSNAAYRPSGPAEHYDTETVYEKINGAAPEYLQLGFRELLARTYDPVDPDLFGCEVFIYDMTTSENARKIFAQQRSKGVKAVNIGVAGYRFGATWFFHQASFYVNVLNADEGKEAERFSEMLARGVAQRIHALPAR